MYNLLLGVTPVTPVTLQSVTPPRKACHGLKTRYRAVLYALRDSVTGVTVKAQKRVSIKTKKTIKAHHYLSYSKKSRSRSVTGRDMSRGVTLQRPGHD